MFICNNCGETFTDGKTVFEFHPYGDGYASEPWAVCPYCEDTDFSEAQQCERCSEFSAELKDGLCEYCRDSEVTED